MKLRMDEEPRLQGDDGGVRRRGRAHRRDARTRLQRAGRACAARSTSTRTSPSSPEELAEKLEFDASGVPVGFNQQERQRDWMFGVLKEDLAYRLLDASGRVVLASSTPEAFLIAKGPGAQAAAQAGQLRLRVRQPADARRHRGRRAPWRSWYLQLAGSARLFELFHLDFALPFMGIGMLLFGSTLLLVFGLCAYVMPAARAQPLHEVSASAAAISPRSVHGRLQVDRVPTEIVPLVESFNRALERLERGYRVQQEFLGTAAHELKTPLALIRAQVEFHYGRGPRAGHAAAGRRTHDAAGAATAVAGRGRARRRTTSSRPTDVGGAAREAVTTSPGCRPRAAWCSMSWSAPRTRRKIQASRAGCMSRTSWTSRKRR